MKGIPHVACIKYERTPVFKINMAAWSPEVHVVSAEVSCVYLRKYTLKINSFHILSL
jgi:hypothetical protein